MRRAPAHGSGLETQRPPPHPDSPRGRGDTRVLGFKALWSARGPRDPGDARLPSGAEGDGLAPFPGREVNG